MSSKIIKTLANISTIFFDRRTLWRLGRFLYLKGRADTIDSNNNWGEIIQSQLLAEISRNNDKLIIFDVGANIGDWTYFILQEVSKLNIDNRLEIYDFEPVPSTFKYLQKRIGKHLLCDRVHFLPVAFSNEEGVAEMFIVGENAGTNSLHLDPMSTNINRIYIQKTTIELYCSRNNIKIIHFLKCDTEGHDIEVLQGARSLFENSKILICQFEYNHRWVFSRHYLRDVFDFAANLSYKIGKITPSGIEIYEKWHPELERFFQADYALISNDLLKWFKTQKGTFDIYNTYHI